jgi:hypothetical protein
MKARRLASAWCAIFGLCVIFKPVFVQGVPVERGFQIPLDSISAETLAEIKNTWKANVIRVHIGNNSEMDGKVGAAYDAMMEGRFALLETKLPLLQASNLKMIFSLTSPPGGFETRVPIPHSLMYSNRALQDEFIAKWRQIVARFGAHPSIAAFDLSSEPAMNKKARNPAARTWNELLLETIAAIRETHPTTMLMVQGLSGAPSGLAALPPINDSNIIYSYNSYLYHNYQHTGVGSAHFSIARPSDDAILNNMRKKVAPFFLKTYNRVQKKQLPASAYPPKIVVGEAAVSACAQESGAFLNGLLSAFEVDERVLGEAARANKLRRWQRARKKNRRLKKPVFTRVDFMQDVQHHGYAYHAFGEAEIWDATLVCDTNGTITRPDADPDRAIVLKSFFSRN